MPLETKKSDIAELDSLSGKVNRSGAQTMGLFLSINGWSSEVPNALKQNPRKSIILMNGNDLTLVLNGKVKLPDLITKKLSHLNYSGEPFLAAIE